MYDKIVNIYDDLLKEEVDLTVQIRAENSNQNTEVGALGRSYLKLYRN